MSSQGGVVNSIAQLGRETEVPAIVDPQRDDTYLIYDNKIIDRTPSFSLLLLLTVKIHHRKVLGVELLESKTRFFLGIQVTQVSDIESYTIYNFC